MAQFGRFHYHNKNSLKKLKYCNGKTNVGM